MRAAPLRPAITTPTCTVGITAFTTPTCTVGITAFTTPTCTVGITAFCPSGGQSRLRLTVIFYPPSSKARKTLWAGSDPRVSALLLAPRSSGPLLAAPSWMEQHACYGLADRKQVALLGTQPQTSRVFLAGKAGPWQITRLVCGRPPFPAAPRGAGRRGAARGDHSRFPSPKHKRQILQIRHISDRLSIQDIQRRA